MPATVTTAERLRGELSDPVRPDEIAKAVGVSLGTVYASMHRFRAAYEASDEQGMRSNIPCHRLFNRFIVPRDRFVEWYLGAGLEP